MRAPALLAPLLLAARLAGGQVPAPAAPLPDIGALLHSVEDNQVALDRAREQYTYRQQQRVTLMDKHGRPKHTDETVSNVFYVHGHMIETETAKNGKPLSPDHLRKEQERATKEALKYQNAPYGQADKDDVSVGRLLTLARFSHPRRIYEGGRPVIVFDFVGDPRAEARSRSESMIKKMQGTLWVDEQAREVSHMQATFDQPLRIGFGIFATLAPGSHFEFEQRLIQNEAWLPTRVDGRFDGRAALFVGFHVDLDIRYDQYRKFGATATQTGMQPK